MHELSKKNSPLEKMNNPLIPAPPREKEPRKSSWSSSDKLAFALFCLAIVVAIILLWIDKSPAAAIISVVAVAGFLVYPILHFFHSTKGRTLGSVVALALLALFFWEIWPWPSAIDSIEISPKQVLFSQVTVTGNSGTVPNLFSQQYSARITNMTGRDVYEIGVRLNIESSSVSIRDFDLGIPKSSQKLLDDSGTNSTQLGDMMAIGCLNKQTNRAFFVVELAHLEPHESREITISETKGAATLVGSVYNATFEPAPLLKTNKGIMFMPHIPLPETVSIESISLLNLPKQP